MHDEEEPEMENFVYKPCKSCGSTTYRNTDGEKFIQLPSGLLSVEPTTCDKCAFDLMMFNKKTDKVQ